MATSSSLSGALQARTLLSDFTLEPLHADNFDSYNPGGNQNNYLSFQPYSGDVTDGWALPNQVWNYSSMDPDYMNAAKPATATTTPPLPPPNSQNTEYDVAPGEYDSVFNDEVDMLFSAEWLQQFQPEQNTHFLANASAAPNDQSTLQPNPPSGPSVNEETYGDLPSDEIDGTVNGTDAEMLKEARWLKRSLTLLRSSDLGEEYTHCVNQWYKLEVSLPWRKEVCHFVI